MAKTILLSLQAKDNHYLHIHGPSMRTRIRTSIFKIGQLDKIFEQAFQQDVIQMATNMKCA